MKTCKCCWGTGKAIDHLKLGQEAWAARAERAESLDVAAKKLGISAPYLSLLENGRRKWTEELFARALDKGKKSK